MTNFLKRGAEIVAASDGPIVWSEPHRGWFVQSENAVHPDDLRTMVVTGGGAGPRMLVTPIEFKLLLTQQERLAIRLARNPAADASAEAKQLAAIVDDFFGLIDDPRLQNVDLTHPTTGAAVQHLELAGLIGDGRAAEILAGIEG